MAQRYYLTKSTVDDLEETLSNPPKDTKDLIDKIRSLVFSTPIPETMADSLEEQLFDDTDEPGM